MKRYSSIFTWAFIAILSFSFVSCNHDDEDEEVSLVGVWVLEKSLPMYYNSEITGYVKAYFQFLEDGSLIEKDVITPIDDGKVYTETSTYGRWSVTDNHLTLIVSFAEPKDNPQEKADVNECTYEFKDGKLILTYMEEELNKMVSITFVRGKMPE